MSYHEICDNLCPDYMAMGMTWDEYWYGDPWMVQAVRKAHQLKQKQKNFELWLQGMYIYEALLDVSPVYHDFAKNPKPQPYASEPYALDENERETREKKEQEELDKQNQATIRAWAERVNRLKAEKEKKGVPNDG